MKICSFLLKINPQCTIDKLESVPEKIDEDSNTIKAAFTRKII